MREKAEEMEILGLEELRSRPEREKQELSIAKAREDNVRENTGGDAQEMLISLIISIGGIRADVYEYLLTPRFSNGQAVASIGRLLCYAAPVEWMQLAVDALERNAGTMYVNEITEAYQDGIPFEEVQEFLEKSKTVFEMCRYRMQASRKREIREEKPSANVSPKGEPELPDSVTGSGKMLEEIKEAVEEAVKTAFMSYGKDNFEEMPGRTEGKGTGEPELPDSVTESDGKELPDSVAEREEPELPDNVTESEKPESELPEFPDGKEIVDKRIFVLDLKKEQENSRKRISFFRILLERHMKKEFARMQPKSQVGKIFEIMVDKKYGKEQILAIRRLMNGGMTNEFIFALLEKDLSGEELTEMCRALLQKEEPEAAEEKPEGKEALDAETFRGILADYVGQNKRAAEDDGREQRMDINFKVQEEYL